MPCSIKLLYTCTSIPAIVQHRTKSDHIIWWHPLGEISSKQRRISTTTLQLLITRRHYCSYSVQVKVVMGKQCWQSSPLVVFFFFFSDAHVHGQGRYGHQQNIKVVTISYWNLEKSVCREREMPSLIFSFQETPCETKLQWSGAVQHTLYLHFPTFTFTLTRPHGPDPARRHQLIDPCHR